MSHYAVLILHKANQNIEDLLAPYDESLKVEPYKEKTRQEAIDYIKEEYVPYNDFMKDYSNDELIEWFVNQYSSYSIGKDGDIYTTYNLDSKWDWYQIGGRFSGSLTLNDEGLADCIREYKDNYKYTITKDQEDDYRTVDSAPVKFIQWTNDFTDKEIHDMKRWWAINIDGEEPLEGEEKDKWFIYNPEYFKKRYKDVDTYIKIHSTVSYHAVVTPDGVWHEPSKMLMFACTDGNPEDELNWDLDFKKNYIDTANPEWIATVVDCHI